MTTTLERLVTEPKHDPEIMLPNVWYDLLHCIEALCPCGSTARVDVREGVLGWHDPAKTWDMGGQGHPLIQDAYGKGPGRGCRYSGRTVTLAAALARDEVLTPVEAYVRRVTQDQLERGVVFTAPEGYTLPKIVAALFALAGGNGWTARQSWTPRDGGYVLSLRVSRAGARLGWQYNLSWFVAPGVARRTPWSLSHTPERPRAHDTPSVKTIRGVIAANPVPEEG